MANVEKNEVLLRFKNAKDKKRFMFGLSDGFGENFCDLEWGVENGVTIDEAKVVYVFPYKDADTSLENDDDEFDDFGLTELDDKY